VNVEDRSQQAVRDVQAQQMLRQDLLLLISESAFENVDLAFKREISEALFAMPRL